VFEDRGDAGVSQHADFDRPSADRLHPRRVEAAEQPQHAEAGAKPLFRMRPARQYRQDQRLGVRTDVTRMASETLRRPLGIASVRTGHVVGQRAVTQTAVASRMARDSLAAVEYLDGARRDAGVDLLADQRVRHRIEKTLDLDMVVDADAGEAPFGILVILLWQRLHGRPLDRLEQLASADAQTTHLTPVHPLECDANRGIAFGQRKEGNVAQTAKNIGLCKADPGLHFGFVFWLSRPCRYNTDIIVCRHFTIATIDFWIIERGLVDPALEIVRDQQPRCRTKEPEHPYMCANPVRQTLRPGGVGIGEVGRAEHRDEQFRHPHLAGQRVDDWHLLAGIVDERLIPSHVRLAHRRRQATLKRPEELTESAIRVTIGTSRLIFLEQDRQIDPGPLHLAHQNRPVGFDITASPRLTPGGGEQNLLQRLVRLLRRQRPDQSGRSRARQIILHRASPDADRPGDHAGAGSRPKMQL
jgi:hypothetical protein